MVPEPVSAESHFFHRGTSFNLGYKRQEFSLIPIGTQGDSDQGEDVYLSVLAAFDLNIANRVLRVQALEFHSFLLLATLLRN